MKKKLPAFGNALLERRRTGEVPLCVHIIYGLQWRAENACAWRGHAIPDAHPLLCLKPADYRPGVYDWRIFTGVYVAVFDQGHERLDDPGQGPPRPWWCRPVYVLMGEIAAFAADVELYADGARWSIGELAMSAAIEARTFRHQGNEQLNHGWPHWWSLELAEKNAERYGTWLAAVSERRLVSA